MPRGLSLTSDLFAELQATPTNRMNVQAQSDEVEALRAIYDDSFRTVNEEQRTHLVHVQSDEGTLHVDLLFIFPEDYPTNSPPVYELRSAPWIDSSELACIDQHFQQVYKESDGEVVVYQWVEWLHEWLSEKARTINSEKDLSATECADCTDESTTVQELAVEESIEMQCTEIVHGVPLTDRKSTFQAHLARVSSTEEVKSVLSELKQNKKIATATHNIMAYRIHHVDSGVYQQDCDDDGEAAAGGRLLHLLQIMDVRNAVVVVTRWYGGIHLHADRFKHINNVARTLIQETGLGLEHKGSSDGKDKKQSKTAQKSKGRHR